VKNLLPDSENPFTPLIRSIVQQVISELREEPLDRGPEKVSQPPSPATTSQVCK
jgi:hypothetical protein